MLTEKGRVLDTPIIRNIHEREWEKIMIGGFHGGGGEYHESEQEKRVDELGEWELSEQTGVGEQELSRLKTTTPQRVLYIVFGSALLLFIIVMIVGANVFHW